MSRPRIFQYALLWHPTEKQRKDDGAKSKIIVAPKDVLAIDDRQAQMMASMEIPAEYRDQLDQVEIAMRPF
jgi:hypothetical protein